MTRLSIYISVIFPTAENCFDDDYSEMKIIAWKSVALKKNLHYSIQKYTSNLDCYQMYWKRSYNTIHIQNQYSRSERAFITSFRSDHDLNKLKKTKQ